MQVLFYNNIARFMKIVDFILSLESQKMFSLFMSFGNHYIPYLFAQHKKPILNFPIVK